MIRMPWTNATAPNVMIEVTNACNLSCRACYKKKGATFKSLDEITQDLDDAGQLRPLHTVTISGGEPTLHPELIEVVRLIKSRGYHVFMLTNGVLVNEAVIRKLTDAGLDSILFHVDWGQDRPDLPKNHDHRDVLKRLSELTQLASARGLDVSISATLYEDGMETLETISRYFFDQPDLSFLYLSRAVDAASLEEVQLGEASGDPAKERLSLEAMRSFFDKEYGIEPFAYIQSSKGREIWHSYFVPMAYKDGRMHRFRFRSGWAEAVLMKLNKLLTGKHVHKTSQKPGLTLFRVLVNGLFSLRLFPLVGFLGKLLGGNSRLRHKMIAYDDGPRSSGPDGVEHCEYCPTAIVRNGRLLPCCTADFNLNDTEEVIATTTAICNDCAVPHAATVVRRENKIEGAVHCPKGEFKHELSSDADMYMAIKEKTSTAYNDASPPEGMRYALNYISITNACNLKCTVCGANAQVGSDSAAYLPLEEICRRAEDVKTYGGRLLHLFGGEPTVHPQLFDVVEAISKMGFATGVVTNGLLLGKDDRMARELKRRGLSRICMQFDSFDPATLDQLGRNCLPEKLAAIKKVLDAGLDLGLNCTVTNHNVDEIADLLTHGIELGTGVKNMTFASAAPVGRYELSSDDSPDREQIIKQLLKAGETYDFSFDDVFPLPAYLPWGTQTHPDCGAHILFIRTPKCTIPLNRMVDLRKTYDFLGKNRMRGNWYTKYVLPSIYLIRSIRRKKLLSLLGTAIGLMMKKPGYSMLNVGVSNYKGAMFLDEQRIDRCASAFYTSQGPVKACIHFLGNQNAPGSRQQEDFSQDCARTTVQL